MELIGIVKHVQIQRSPLKIGSPRVYSTAPIKLVDALRLTPRGGIGLMDDGTEIIDVHHVDHRESRNRGNANGISVNFTGHYDQMRARFGSHLVDGCAGESILVESSRIWTLAELGERLAVEHRHNGAIIFLDDLLDAPPCIEFSRFASSEQAPEIIKTTLQFLDNGMRGFYATVNSHAGSVVRAGDKLYIP